MHRPHKVNKPFFVINLVIFTLCYERNEPLDVQPYAFGQGAAPFVSSVLHYFSTAPETATKFKEPLISN